jgi:hypothetical protein
MLVVAVAVVAAWWQGPAAKAMPVSPALAAPVGSRSAALPGNRLWTSAEAQAQPTRSASNQFVAISGVGCRATAEAGHYITYPAGSVPDTRRGGWGASGCAGVFWTVPMSGNAQDDPHVYVLWWFAPNGMTHGSCDVMVFVPNAARPEDAAGHPTVYVVLRGRDDHTVVGTFSIDQTVNRGRWVRAGRYSLDNGQIAVKMINRGTNSTDRHGAAQVWVECIRQ